MLTVDHVSVSYGKSRAVCGVSFSVEDGGRLAVLGRNGVGKTTLLKSIVGLLPLSGGRILYNGRDLSGLRPCFRSRMGIAYVPQGREILPQFTVRENLELGCLSVRDRKAVALRTEKMLGYFPVLSAHLERKGGVLSGGQQQQLAIARALMTSPGLLLLDEPTEGIQPNMVEELGRILNRICREMPLSVVLVEQNLKFAEKMTNDYIILQKGEVCAAGKTAGLDASSVKRFLSV